MSVTIYHNPDCGTSRNTLAMIRNAGIEPEIIEYLKNPPSRETPGRARTRHNSCDASASHSQINSNATDDRKLGRTERRLQFTTPFCSTIRQI